MKGKKTIDGVYYFPAGTKCVGAYKNGRFNGQGVMTWMVISTLVIS